MENNKKTLQYIVASAFVLALLGFMFYAFNQLQLNKDSKVIIDSNNQILNSFSNQFKDSIKAFENIDSLKIDDSKQTSLSTLVNSFPPQIESSKNELKPGINSPSNNNYKFAISKLDSDAKAAKDLKDLFDTKVCLKIKYINYSTTLTNITDLQDAVAKANSFSDSKTALNNLKISYQKLITNAQEVGDCFTLDSLSDLKKSITDSAEEDKKSIEDYQTNYLDPLLAIYDSEDYTKIGAFIDAHPDVSVKIKLPSLFDNSLETSIADKIMEEVISSIISNI